MSWGEVLPGNTADADRWAYCGDCGRALVESSEQRFDHETGQRTAATGRRKYCPHGHQLIWLEPDGPRLP